MWDPSGWGTQTDASSSKKDTNTHNTFASGGKREGKEGKREKRRGGRPRFSHHQHIGTAAASIIASAIILFHSSASAVLLLLLPPPPPTPPPPPPPSALCYMLFGARFPPSPPPAFLHFGVRFTDCRHSLHFAKARIQLLLSFSVVLVTFAHVVEFLPLPSLGGSVAGVSSFRWS